MTYLVLARKYRPTTFAEVVGQDHVTQTLANAFATRRVHHAFLFCGPRGCGKTTLARIVGKALNCEQRDPATAEPCGTCSACRSISDGSAVDYQEMDGASNRGIDAIRELTEAVRYQPAVLRKKVYVIDEVHMLTTEAFNALLKTLEEPPPHVTFVLATTEPHKLPNTILSRCQRYDFKLVPSSRLAQHLAKIFATEKLAIDAGAISLLVRESGGSVRDALSLCDQLISYVGATTITEKHVAEVLGVADRSLTRELVGAVARGDAGGALTSIETAIERGVDEIQLARAIVRYLRDLSVLQVAPDRPELVDASDEERATLVAEAGQLERSRVTQMFERMLRCCDELGKTLQPRLVLDCALIDVATTEPLVPLGDLLERLGELEQRLAKGGGGAGPSKAALKMTAPGSVAPPPVRVAAPRVQAATVVPVAPVPVAVASAPAPDPRRTTTPGAGGPALSTSFPPEVGTDDVGAARSSRLAGEMTMAQALEAELARKGLQAPAPAPPPPAPKIGSETLKGNVVSPMASTQPSGPVPKAASVASGSGPLTTPTNAEAALKAWNDVLSQLETRRKFSLLTYFQSARVLRWTADEVELGFATDVHHMGEMAGEKQNLEDMRAVLRELGQNVRLAVRLLDERESTTNSARSILEATRESSNAERIKREAEARAHPMTKQVLQTFGAQIKEIKTDV